MAQRARLELEADSSQIKTATSELKTLETQGTKTEKAAKNITTSTNKAGSAVSGLGRNAGQAGIQVQQFVGQIQGGQSAMLALSQQSADLGIVLGAPLIGVVTALTASAIGMALSMESADTAAEELESILEKLKTTLDEDEQGVKRLSSEILSLAKSSETLAKVQVAKSITDSNQQIKIASGAIKNLAGGIRVLASVSSDQFFGLQVPFEELEGKITDVDSLLKRGLSVDEISNFRFEIDKTARSFGINFESAARFNVALADIRKNANPSTIKAFQTELENVNEATGFGNEKITKFTEQFIPFIKQFDDGVENVNTLRVFLSDFSREVEETGDKLDPTTQAIAKLTASLEVQKIALEQGELESQLYAAALATGATSADDLDEGIKKLIIDLNASKLAKEADIKATRELAAAEALAAREKAQLSTKFDTLSTTLTGEQGGAAGRVQQEYEQRLAIITQYEKSIGAEVGSLEAERLLAFQSFEKKKTDITTAEAEKRKQLELQSNQSMLGATADLFGNLADIAKEGGEKSFNDYKNFASAQAALNAALAITNVLGSPFTTLNPIAGAALATSIGALAGVQVAKIQSQEYSGFEQGGYTGSYGTKEVAGVVHGQEFVVNAPNTKKNRATLEAMNRGEDISKMGGGNTITNQDTINFNVVSPSNQEMTKWAISNQDLFVNIIRRAKRAQGVAF